MDDFRLEGYIVGVYAERYGMASRDPAVGYDDTMPLEDIEENFREFFKLLSVIEDFAHEVYHG